MKTKNDVLAIREASTFAYQLLCDRMKSMIETLEKIVGQGVSEHDSPEHSARIFIEAVGKRRAEIVLASLVNHVSWDGRISGENVQWARSCTESFDEDAMSLMRLYSDKIHCAHLDQLADVFRKSA